MWRHLLLILAASVHLHLALAERSATSSNLKSTRDNIAPVFRRKPFKKISSTTSTERPETEIQTETKKKSTTTSNSKTTSLTTTNIQVKIVRKIPTVLDGYEDKFYVGKEHYYDNKIDILQENDDLEIVEDDEEYSDDTVDINDENESLENGADLLSAGSSEIRTSNSAEGPENLSYDNDDYYYYEDETDEDYFRRKQRELRAERLRRMQERRRAWLQKQRKEYYRSLSRWRHPQVEGYRRPVLATRPGLPKQPQVYNQGAKRPRAYRRPQPQPKQKAEVILEAVETAEAAAALDTDNRRHYDAVAARGESTSLMRSILGVTPFCVHEDAQFSCTFTPLCWMHGGVAMSGCDSMLYSCCVSHTIARRQDTFIGTGRAQKRVAKEILHNEPECGITRHRQFAKRIIGGHKAKFAELPWQVHIRISSYQCGGVLLNNQYVATAAHCVHQAKLSQITVHLGEFDTKNTKKVFEPLESESYRVEHITLHPDFRYMLTQPDRFDVAVLKLDRPVDYQDNILPICLPTSDYDLVGKIGVVAGWGKTDNSFGKTGTNILHKVLVPIIENDRCRAWHRDKAIAVQLHEEMFCAGHKVGKQDACLGDSGGPLVINFDGKWTLIGITSAGFGCAVEKQPGIYHKISKTAKWIAQQINTRDSPRKK